MMPARHSRLILIATVALITLLGTALGAQDTPPRDPEVVRERLEELRGRMEEVQARLARDTRRRDELAGELADAEKRLGRIAGSLRDIEQQLSATRERLTDLESRRQALRASLGKQRSSLADSVRSAYAMGRQERLKMLLNQESVAEAGRVMAYYRYLHQARVSKIEAVTDQLEQLARVESDIVKRETELADLRERRALELEAEQAAVAQRQQVLASIRERVAERGQTLAALKRDEESLESLLEEIESALADVPQEIDKPFGGLRGELGWPLEGERKARADGRGLLIPAESGARVRAVAPGRVAYADWLRGYGLLIILDHGDGYMTLYAHHHTLYRNVGDWVSAGESLGEVGASGGREEPALYFELRQDGEPIQARAWLKPTSG
jgi:septal ring factor EnvC (AmiA/AmiB activator)